MALGRWRSAFSAATSASGHTSLDAADLKTALVLCGVGVPNDAYAQQYFRAFLAVVAVTPPATSVSWPMFRLGMSCIDLDNRILPPGTHEDDFARLRFAFVFHFYDVDGDGAMNASDFAHFLRHLLKYNDKAHEQADVERACADLAPHFPTTQKASPLLDVDAFVQGVANGVLRDRGGLHTRVLCRPLTAASASAAPAAALDMPAATAANNASGASTKAACGKTDENKTKKKNKNKDAATADNGAAQEDDDDEDDGDDNGSGGAAAAAAVEPEPTEICAICFDELIKPGQSVAQTGCGHGFHLGCLLTNARLATLKCPLCRQPVEGLSEVNRTRNGGGQPGFSFGNGGGQPGFSFGRPAFSFGRPSRPARTGFGFFGNAPNNQPFNYQANQQPFGAPAPADNTTEVWEAPLTGAAATSARANASTDGIRVYDDSAAHELTVTTTVELSSHVPGSDEPFDGVVHVRGAAWEPDRHTMGLDVIILADTSSSMCGRPLEMLQRSIAFAASQLGERDRLALVAFNSDTDFVLPLTCMTEAGKADVERIARDLSANGGTNINNAVAFAQRIIQGRRLRRGAATVLLMSDGQDNGADGNAAPTLDASMSCVGLGVDHDARRLASLAEINGNGGFAYAAGPDDLPTAFATCLATRMRTVAFDVEVELENASSLRVQTHRIRNLEADQTRDIFFGARTSAPDPFVCIRVSYRSAATGQRRSFDLAPSLPAGDGSANPAGLLTVDQNRVRQHAVVAMRAAMSETEQGNYDEALRLLESERSTVAAAASAATAPTRLLLTDVESAIDGVQTALRTRQSTGIVPMGASAQLRSVAHSHQSQTPSGLVGASYATPFSTRLVAVASATSRNSSSSSSTRSGRNYSAAPRGPPSAF